MEAINLLSLNEEPEHGDGDEDETDYMIYTITCVDNGYVVESIEDHKVFIKKTDVLKFLEGKL